MVNYKVMAASIKTPPSPGLRTLAYPLFFLALYTLIVKFLNPIVYYATDPTAMGLSDIPIMWDFWWAIHLFLGACLLRREKFVWGLAFVVSIVEIAIIVIKFWLFWQHPNFTFWTLSWYVNKCFVLSYFVCLLICLFLPSVQRDLRSQA